MVELCHEIGTFMETICFHQSIKYVLLINFHQTCDFLTGYDLKNHMSVEFCINSKYCLNYKRLKTKKNKENHKVTHSAQSLYGKVWAALQSYVRQNDSPGICPKWKYTKDIVVQLCLVLGHSTTYFNYILMNNWVTWCMTSRKRGKIKPDVICGRVSLPATSASFCNSSTYLWIVHAWIK